MANRFYINVVMMILLFTTFVYAQDNLHSIAEIIEILEKSQIFYEVSTDSFDITMQDSSIVLHSWYYQSCDSNGISVNEFVLTDSLMKLENASIFAKFDQDFVKAFKYYNDIIKLDSNYYKVYTWIGNTHYIMEQYDSARFYFEKSLELNPIDYQANWFLADTYYHLGSLEKAKHYIVKAHLYNYHHNQIYHRMKEYFEMAGDSWNSWSFEPKYKLEEKDDTIKIYYQPDWLGYALVKAVWKYEPGYAASMVGDFLSTEMFTSSIEEKESLIAYYAQNDTLAMFKEIILDDYSIEFMYYEIWAKKMPLALLMFSEKQIERMIEYLEKYH